MVAWTPLWSAAAWAQTPPAADVADEDDIEVPAVMAPPAAAQGAAVPASPEPVPTSTPETPQAAAPATAEPSVPAVRAVPAEASAGAGSPERAGLRISGYLHAQYLHTQSSQDQLNASGQPLNENEFTLRRARLRFDRVWDYAAAAVELDANTTRGPVVGIRRAEASIFYRGHNAPELSPLVGLMLGILDIPFGFELPESAHDRIFMERTLGSSALFPTEMDAGVKLFGAYSMLRYAVAATNGEPVDRNGLPHDPNAAKDVSGRFGAEGEIAERFKLGGGTSFVVGKGFHRGQPGRKSVIRWRDENEDGVLQTTEIVATPATGATPSKNFDRWVLGLDLQASLRTAIGRTIFFGEAFVASSYDRGYAPADPAISNLDVREAGGYVALAQELTPYALVGLRASVYDPNSDLLETRANETVPKTQTVRTLSALAELRLPGRARLGLQYDNIKDYLARDRVGVPTDAKNNRWTLRLGVDL